MTVSKITYACSGAVEHVVGLPNDTRAYRTSDKGITFNGEPVTGPAVMQVFRAVLVASEEPFDNFLFRTFFRPVGPQPSREVVKDEAYAAKKESEKNGIDVTYRGQLYVVSPCDGEAHSPEVGGMIDHCASCAPSWGKTVRLADGSRPSTRVHQNVMKKYERYMEASRAQKRLRLRQPARQHHQAAERGDDQGASLPCQVYRPARQGWLVRAQRQALLGR